MTSTLSPSQQEKLAKKVSELEAELKLGETEWINEQYVKNPLLAKGMLLNKWLKRSVAIKTLLDSYSGGDFSPKVSGLGSSPKVSGDSTPKVRKPRQPKTPKMPKMPEVRFAM